MAAARRKLVVEAAGSLSIITRECIIATEALQFHAVICANAICSLWWTANGGFSHKQMDTLARSMP